MSILNKHIKNTIKSTKSPEISNYSHDILARLFKIDELINLDQDTNYP